MGEKDGGEVMFAYVAYAVGYVAWLVSRLLRSSRRPPEYILVPLTGPLPQFTDAPPGLLRYFMPRPTSMEGLRTVFRRIAGDGRVKGVVLQFSQDPMSLARAEELKLMINRLQQAGKRVIVWAHTYDTAAYYAACAADRVLLQPGGIIAPLGLSSTYIHLADALKAVGIEAEFLQVSPYKTAGDTLSRSEMSDEAREMANWMADAEFQQIVEAISRGRNIDDDAARALIDGSPYMGETALETGAVDALVNIDDIAAHLGRGGKPARVAAWQQARGQVFLMKPPAPGKYVAVMRIEGSIVPGTSARRPHGVPPVPLFGGDRAGDLTVTAEARRLMADRRVGAVVVYVDSPGGSAAASEAMAQALVRLNRAKPVVIAMGGTAASGGYYVATPGRWIVAQPGTLTGSIGVLTGKITDEGLMDRLRINRETVSRGKNIEIFGTAESLTDEQREIVLRGIEEIYDLFLRRVMEARGMDEETLLPLAGGKVWTGRQAKESGLVDQLGGLEEAAAKARELAGMAPDRPVRQITGRTPFMGPPGEPKRPAAGLLKDIQNIGQLLFGAGSMFAGPQMLTAWVRRQRY